MKKFYLTIGIVLAVAGMTSDATAQLNDTIRLNPVEVTGSRATVFTGGITTLLSDSSRNTPFHTQPLSELLSYNSSVFIKSYGSGGSATISSRGTEARHSAILWNGFNLNSATLGVTDLSMIPVFLTDKISLMHGGSSPVNGNSAIGGSVVFENSISKFVNSTTATLIAEGGSFGNSHVTAGVRWSNRFMESKTTVFYDAAKNNFTYTNFTHRNKPEVEQQHAAYSNYGLVQDFQFKLNGSSFITTGIWYQVTDRQLAPLMTVPGSQADQRDSTLRTYLGYKLLLKKSALSVKGGYFRDFQFYTDAKYGYDNTYLVNNYFGEAEYRIFLNEKLVINTGVTYNEGVASFEEYTGRKNRTIFSAFTDLRYRIAGDWHAGLNLRQEFSNIDSPPFAPSMIVEGTLIKYYLYFLARAGRNYNLPSMNDLYWIPGGNPDLLSEDAWGEEVSLVIFKNHKYLPMLTLTAFNSVVENWIKWQPAAGGVYSPNNLREVHARGIEGSLNYSKKIKNWFFEAALMYTWCRSSVSEATSPAEQVTLDKQLVYVPESVASGNFTIRWRSLSLFSSNTYVGERFTTNDNSTFLEDYFVANLSLETSLEKLRIPAALYVKVMNLTDFTYQVMAYRPMPGRWYSAGIKINFQHSDKNQTKK